MIYHFYCFLGKSYKYEPGVCNSCHDISMMAYQLVNIAMLKIKGNNYRCIKWKMSRSDAICRLSNSKLDAKGSS